MSGSGVLREGILKINNFLDFCFGLLWMIDWC